MSYDDAGTCTSACGGTCACTCACTGACGVACACTGYHNDNESNAGNLAHAIFNDNDYKSATGIPGCDDDVNDNVNWNSYDLTGNELDDSGLQRR